MNFKAVILSVMVGLYLSPMSVFAHNMSNGRANADSAQTIEKEILRLEEVGRQKVLKGDNNWDDLIAEGAYMIAYDGSIMVYQKGQQLPSLAVKSFKMSDMIVRVYGDAAVVTGRVNRYSQRSLDITRADGLTPVLSETTIFQLSNDFFLAPIGIASDTSTSTVVAADSGHGKRPH